MTAALSVRSTRFSVLRWLALSLAVLVAPFLSACGYNDFQAKDEATKAAWAEVVNQYQRRADLIPNLVNTVKGYASHEKDTLEAVTKARAAATSFQITPEVLNDPAAFQKFQELQGQLSSALSRLMAVSENYPQLKADQSFRDLQSQLEGTENRITVARQRYIKSVQERAGPQLPDQPDGQGDGLPGQAELHGREREGHLHRPGGEVLTS